MLSHACTIITMKLIIPKKISDKWNIDKRQILESETRTGGRMFKFCYQPQSGEFLCAMAPMSHSVMIKLFGSRTFEEYIRGIYFRSKWTVYLREHEREDWLEITALMLRRFGVPRNMRIIWGRRAARELEEDLRGL